MAALRSSLRLSAPISHLSRVSYSSASSSFAGPARTMGLKSLLSRSGESSKSTPPTAAPTTTPTPTATTTPAAATTARSSSTSSPSSLASSKAFLDAIRSRRSVYALNSSSPISDSEIQSIIEQAILHTPSSFNSQSTRVVLLLNDQHQVFWELVRSVLKPRVSEEQFVTTSAKLDGFKAGHGTVLFYEDQTVVKHLEDNFTTYADKFQQWSEHASAMHQLVVWTALEQEGFGANLQHYNPLVDQQAAAQFEVPDTWNLKSQLVFGGRVEGQEPKAKEFKPVEGERLKVFGKK